MYVLVDHGKRLLPYTGNTPEEVIAKLQRDGAVNVRVEPESGGGDYLGQYVVRVRTPRGEFTEEYPATLVSSEFSPPFARLWATIVKDIFKALQAEDFSLYKTVEGKGGTVWAPASEL